MANIFKTDRLFLSPPNSIVSSKTNIQLKPIQEIFFTFLQIHNLDLKQKIKINQKPSNPDSKDKISNNVNIKGSIYFHNISLKIILNN